jgi:hypothetical protein
MKADYKTRRAARHAVQKVAPRNARSLTAGLRNHPTHQWTPTPLRDAAHEIGHGAVSIPESDWHLGLGTYSQCPACNGLPPMDTHGLSLAAHQRNVTRGNTPAYEIDPFEALYYAVAGGAAEAVCFGDEPMPFLFYSGNPNPFPYGMDDDFRELRNKAPNLLAVAHLAYRDLYEFLRPHRAALLSYAEQLVERRVLHSSEIHFPFDAARIRFNGLKGVDPAYAAHVAGVCHRCGQATRSWGFCMDCRFQED